MSLTDGLIGHWPLTSDGRDHSDVGHATHAHRVAFENDGALFNGRDSEIRVSDHPALALGANDFTISAHVHTEETLSDVIGDIASKFDPIARRGFNFNIVEHQGMATCQANYRNVHFGIDDGKQDDGFTDCGRPGAAKQIAALTVFEGELYASTFEWGADEHGRVMRYDGDNQWHDCGLPTQANDVPTMAVYNGKLYAGTGRYKCAGSHMPLSPNENPGGRIYRYEGNNQWTDCGQLGDGDMAISLTVFDGKLYATSHYHRGAFVYDGDKSWRCIGPDLRLMAFAAYNGHLYSSANGDQILRYDGDNNWSTVAVCPKTTQTYAMAVYEGDLCITTWPNALNYKFDGENLDPLGNTPGHEKETMGIAVYNGMLYIGSLPLANVYRFDRHNPTEYEGHAKSWTPIDSIDLTRKASIRRAWTFAVYRGQLFAGTLPSGHVHRFQAGRMATYDHALAPGWRHLVATRAGDRLKIHVDGRCAAESATMAPADFDLTNDLPLLIGMGAHDHFNGRMRDFRLYDRALKDSEIAALAGV